jgi:protein-S-isoprenylcysteine O-methyltransferase Ste14
MVLIVADVFKKHQTAIQPWKTTTVLVTDGLYARSRNPIYAGFCLVNVGLGLVADNLWLVLSALPGAWLVTKIAIEKEEAYLEQVFGQEYLDYKDKVRRWL